MLVGTTTDYQQREERADKVLGLIPVEEEESNNEAIVDIGRPVNVFPPK